MINYYNYPHTNLALPARYGGASHYPHDTFIMCPTPLGLANYNRKNASNHCADKVPGSVLYNHTLRRTGARRFDSLCWKDRLNSYVESYQAKGSFASMYILYIASIPTAVGIAGGACMGKDSTVL
jgi:hypothetical protein